MTRAPQRLYRTLNKFFSNAEGSPRTCHELRERFHLLGHMEPQHLIKKWSTLRAFLSLVTHDAACLYQPLSSAPKVHMPDATCPLPNQLWSRWSHRARERFQPCAPSARVSPSERESGKGDSSTSLTPSEIAWI